MIIDLQHFVNEERPYWEELERLLERIQSDIGYRLDLGGLKRFYYLYQRVSTDLAKVAGSASEPELRCFLETLVARAYGEIHEVRRKSRRLALIHWFFYMFPHTFRRHLWAFGLTVSVTLVGAVFGAGAVLADPEAKDTLIPFPHLRIDPGKRVEWEERGGTDRLEGARSLFSAVLMTHNTRVAIFTMALGMTWGLGTIVLLFYNGVLLGAIVADYLAAGQGVFLLGWLLPHGAVEIPAILIAGQCGLLLGRALIGWGTRLSLKGRLRQVGPEIVTLFFGVALLLVWAGLVEAFFSQYHEPFLPYSLKIGFGALELALLALFLSVSGLRRMGKER